MTNRKTWWLGLIACSAIAPILVAKLPPLTAQPIENAPINSSDPAKKALGAPVVNPFDPTPIAAMPVPNGGKALPIPSSLSAALLPPSPAPASVQNLDAFPSGSAPFLPEPPLNPIQQLIAAQEKEPAPKEPPQPAQAAPTPTPTETVPQKFGPPARPEGQGPAALVGQGANPAAGIGDRLTDGAQGVEVQRRSALVADPRIEGMHFGQIVTSADGAFWFPARVDLDTVISKLNSSDINSMLVIKGPFSVRYGPGFSFLDIESTPTPRSQNGFDVHGSTSATYRTNGEGFLGQQAVYGGDKDWGFRLSYDLQSAGDYTTGNGTKLPSSYNNQFVNFALGIDLTSTSSLEVKYMHVQQSNVLFPGLLTDINNLATDGFTARYTAKDGAYYDRLTIDTWVNTTSFNGDSANPQTRAQIPQLNSIFPIMPGGGLSPAQVMGNQAIFTNLGGPTRLDINTNGYALSYGAREMTTWGDVKGFNVNLGADIRVFANTYNEFDSFNLSTANGSTGNTALPANFGIPSARQVDPGIFLDSAIPFGEQLQVKVGTRVNFLTSEFVGFGQNVDQAKYIAEVGDPHDDKFYLLFSAFATAEYKLSDHWTAQAGYGYAQRAPTLTELYAGGSFLGLVQNGLNSVFGNVGLQKEQIHQLNVGINGTYENARAGFNAFYAFMPDYITMQNQGLFQVQLNSGGNSFTGTTPITKLQFINTPLATLYGFDAFAEYDVLPYLTPFANLSFVEGWDQGRDEALPGISPLDSRVGLRIHEPGKDQRWGVEYSCRMVATQDLFAASLNEQRTGGFVVHNLRAYWQARKNLLLTTGIDNIGNRQYQEHLDLRTGDGTYQPGINFYFGMKVSY